MFQGFHVIKDIETLHCLDGYHIPGLKNVQLVCFRPFERLESPDLSNGDAAGTGLGLAIVREIAEGHGGSARALRPADGAGLMVELRVPEEKP